MATKEKITGRFSRGLLVYAVILLTLILLGLCFFYFYIYEYEYSRPSSAMDRYITSFDDDAIQERAGSFLSSLDPNIQSPQESFTRIRATLQDLSYAKLTSESTDSRMVYVLRNAGEPVGKVTLTPSSRAVLGFVPWTVSETELQLDHLCGEAEFTVPHDFKVVCNGYTLDPSYIVDYEGHYPLLDEFYDDNFTLPTLYTYRVDRYIGTLDAQVLDAQGRVIPPEELEDEAYLDRYTDNCTEAEKQEIEEFIHAYIERYVTYLSGANGYVTANYYSVLEYTLEGSDLRDRITQSMVGQGFASSNGDIIRSITINQAMNAGNGVYVCDITYLVDTYGSEGMVTTTNNSKVVMVRTDSGLKAAAQASY